MLACIVLCPIVRQQASLSVFHSLPPYVSERPLTMLVRNDQLFLHLFLNEWPIYSAWNLLVAKFACGIHLWRWLQYVLLCSYLDAYVCAYISLNESGLGLSYHLLNETTHCGLDWAPPTRVHVAEAPERPVDRSKPLYATEKCHQQAIETKKKH